MGERGGRSGTYFYFICQTLNILFCEEERIGEVGLHLYPYIQFLLANKGVGPAAAPKELLRRS